MAKLSLKTFVFYSLLWHCLQVGVFTFFFKIEPIAIAKEQAGILEISLELEEKKSNLIFKRNTPKAKEPFSERKKVLNNTVKHKVTLPVARKIVPKTYTKLTKNFIEKKVVVNKRNGAEVAHTAKPFIVEGELRARKIIESPNLPKYPEWALQADVELRLTIGLLVKPDGEVQRAWIVEPSGDSQTDSEILNYVESLVFEEKSWTSKGSIKWEFKIKF